jgi:hypothetical protein
MTGSPEMAMPTIWKKGVTGSSGFGANAVSLRRPRLKNTGTPEAMQLRAAGCA